MLPGQRYFISKPIALIGFMGAGKTSIAKLLEEHTGIKSYDTDKQVVASTQKTVSEIINNEGEESFRKIETKVFTELVEKGNCIIATGGGIIESAASRGELKKCFSVWLQVDSTNSSKRIDDYSKRPMFKDIENASNLLIRRNDIYSQYSDVAIDTNNKAISQVLKEVMDALIKAEVLQY